MRGANLFIIVFLLMPVVLLGDGFIIIDPPRPLPPRPVPVEISPYPLAVTRHHVQVRIREQAATTEVDQVFRNPTRRQLQGYYIFPIPAGAAIDNFSLEINGKAVKGELLDAEDAARYYREQVRKWIDPALLEYQGGGLIKVRIFPFAPGEERRVTLRYREALSSEFDLLEYRYQLSTEKFSSEPINSVRIQVDLQSEQPILEVFSPTHPVETVSHGSGHWQAVFEAENVKPRRDFRLFFRRGGDGFSPSFLTYRDAAGGGYFMLTLPGNSKGTAAAQPKDIIFLLDASGSMKEAKLSAARKALLYCIRQLGTDDRFDIIRFSTQAQSLFGELAPGDSDHRREAAAFVEGISAIGGTNYQAALEKLRKLSAASTDQNRPRYAIFITDGKPTVGETRPEQLLQLLPGGVRIFTFGIGYEVNTVLLDRISHDSRGTRRYVTPDEDILQRITGFYQKVAEPIMSNIRIRAEGDIQLRDMYPLPLPDVFRGNSLIVFGRFSGSGRSTLVIDGDFEGQRRQFRLPIKINQPDQSYDFIPPLWANRAVGYLLDQVRLHGETEELKQEIIHLAKQFGIVTPYTSYLLLEDEQQISRAPGSGRIPLMPEEIREDAGVREQAQSGYQSLKEQSGAGSVKGSRDIVQQQSMQSVYAADDLKKTLQFSKETGQHRQLDDFIRVVSGRAFYLHGDTWVDANLDEKITLQVRKIAFGGKEYFRLLEGDPGLRSILALGPKLRFLHGNRIIEISDTI